MIINKICLTNYRNITALEMLPHKSVNIIHGDNAQGKTNLIEAIYLLTGQKSFRGAKDSDTIRFGEDIAQISAEFFCNGREQEAQLFIGKKKKAFLNEVEITPSEIMGRFYAVVFSPTELALVKDGPVVRRTFLDNAISQVLPRYRKTLNQLNRAIYQRNSLLSDIRKRIMPEDVLDTWDISFAKVAVAIINARSRYFARIQPCAVGYYEDISHAGEAMSLKYRCGIPDYDVSFSPSEGEEFIIKKLRETREEDIKNVHSTIGPHRDDFEININGEPARSFGSQGQQRSCALAIKLAECTVLEQVTGEKPIVLLDDVLSELDKKRRKYFLSGIPDTQVFITGCDRLSIAGLGSGKLFHMEHGILRERSKKTSKK